MKLEEILENLTGEELDDIIYYAEKLYKEHNEELLPDLPQKAD